MHTVHVTTHLATAVCRDNTIHRVRDTARYMIAILYDSCLNTSNNSYYRVSLLPRLKMERMTYMNLEFHMDTFDPIVVTLIWLRQIYTIGNIRIDIATSRNKYSISNHLKISFQYHLNMKRSLYRMLLSQWLVTHYLGKRSRFARVWQKVPLNSHRYTDLRGREEESILCHLSEVSYILIFSINHALTTKCMLFYEHALLALQNKGSYAYCVAHVNICKIITRWLLKIGKV